MDDQKDRLGDKIHDLEKAREDQWARDQDRMFLERIRAQHGLPVLHCPRFDAELVSQADNESSGMAGPNGHGAWSRDPRVGASISQGDDKCAAADRRTTKPVRARR